MLMEAQETNLRIQEVNIDARYDVDGSTVSPGRHGSSVLGRIITLVSEKRPLLFFGVAAAPLLLPPPGPGGVVLVTYHPTPPPPLSVGLMFIFRFFFVHRITPILLSAHHQVLV